MNSKRRIPPPAAPAFYSPYGMKIPPPPASKAPIFSNRVPPPAAPSLPGKQPPPSVGVLPSVASSLIQGASFGAGSEVVRGLSRNVFQNREPSCAAEMIQLKNCMKGDDASLCVDIKEAYERCILGNKGA